MLFYFFIFFDNLFNEGACLQKYQPTIRSLISVSL